MKNILKNWIKKLQCEHKYEFLCHGENAYMEYRFYKCKKCGKTKIESFGK